jgi:NADPH-dependent ferric siderophore reductase
MRRIRFSGPRLQGLTWTPGQHVRLQVAGMVDAYLAGEARTIQTLRKMLVTERGWDRRNIRTKPFWTPGRSGVE